MTVFPFRLADNMWLYILALVCPLWFIHRWYKERKRVPNRDEKYVYITGCDTGFGNLLARHLDQMGYRVIAGCYTEKGEDELKKSASDRLSTVQLDVSDSPSVARAAAFIRTLVGENGELRVTVFLPGVGSFSLFSPLTHLHHSLMISSAVCLLLIIRTIAAGLWAVVNNAGIALPSAPTDWLTIQDYKPMLAVNLCGVIDVTLSVLSLIKRTRGRVVNVASVFGRVSAFGGPYCISKYGVEAFNDHLR